MARQDNQSGHSGSEKPGGSGNRGFAAMDQAQQREIASRGGKAAHEQGTAHEFTSEEARAAGRKGGQAAHQSGNAHEFTSEEARAAGRKGGQASQGSRERLQQGDQRNQPTHMQQGEPADSQRGRQTGELPSQGRQQQADDAAAQDGSNEA